VSSQVVIQAMKRLAIPYKSVGNGRITIVDEMNQSQMTSLSEALNSYSIKLVLDEENALVDLIKDCVRMVVADKRLRKKNLSTILSEKLGYIYAHLSTLFSSETFTSIENFHIFVKIEKAKELLATGKRTLSEVAHELDYSSVSHLSRQFKNVTGLTASLYLKLLKNRLSQNEQPKNI